MMHFHTLTLFIWSYNYLLTLARQSPPVESPKNSEIIRDVAIIGGGASGAYAASRLEELGYSVAVIEAESVLGGHSQTYTDSRTQQAIEYGVVFFHDNEVTRAFFNQYGIEAYKNSITDPGHRIEFWDLDDGRQSEFQPPQPSAVQAALDKYAEILAANYSYLEFGYDLPDPVPEELLMPFLEFVHKHGLEDMLNLAFQMGQGYGDFLNVPTLYAMKILSHDILKQVEQGSLLRMRNNSELYDRVRARLHTTGSVFLNSTVLESFRVDDPDELNSLLVQTPAGNVSIRSRFILNTIPPTVDTLDAFFDVDEKERSIFSRFECNYYRAGVLRNAHLPTLEIQNAHSQNPGGVPNLPGMYVFEATEAPDIHTFWYGADTVTHNQTEETVKQYVMDTVETIRHTKNRSTTTESEHQDMEFLAIRNFSPFACMVTSEAIRDGFYRELYSLQGRRKTWWTGAAWHTHDSSKLWESTRLLVDRMVAEIRAMENSQTAHGDL